MFRATARFVVLSLALCAAMTNATAQSANVSARGELLYTTHCIACHTTQVHWRDKRLVKDWASLQGQVFRWQNNTGLGWTVEDINEVARYLNAQFYRFPEPGAISRAAQATVPG
jgi:mono/diheme cytochrome c family protein